MRYILSLLLLLPVASYSATPTCAGKVIQILDWNYCDGHLAYRLDTSNGKWICSKSSNSDSMVLTAYATGKKLSASLNDVASDTSPKVASSCEDLQDHHVPRYTV